MDADTKNRKKEQQNDNRRRNNLLAGITSQIEPKTTTTW